MGASVYSAATISASITLSDSDSRSRWIRSGSSSISSGSGSSSNSPMISSSSADLIGASVDSIARAAGFLGSLGPAMISEIPSKTASHGFVIPTSTDMAFFAASPLMSRASLPRVSRGRRHSDRLSCSEVSGLADQKPFPDVILLWPSQPVRFPRDSHRHLSRESPRSASVAISLVRRALPFWHIRNRPISGTESAISDGFGLRWVLRHFVTPPCFGPSGRTPFRHTSRSHRRHLNDTPGRYLTERRAHRDRTESRGQKAPCPVMCRPTIRDWISAVPS